MSAAAPSIHDRISRTTPESTAGIIGFGLVVVVVATLPFWDSDGSLQTPLVVILYYLALAQMWNLLAGFAGLISVGQQTFVGIGIYSLLKLRGGDVRSLTRESLGGYALETRTNSRMGLALRALRDNPTRARALGVEVTRTRLEIWILTAFWTGATGAVILLNTTSTTANSGFSVLRWTALFRCDVVSSPRPTAGNRGEARPCSPDSKETVMTNITPAEHLDEVLSRYRNSPDPRLAEITTAAIRHLHAFVEEVSLTRDEWFLGIQALTEIGQLCDDKRQEFILLSDTLGVSMLVEMINQAGAEGTTEPTVFGPFHVDDAPRRNMGDSIVIDRGEADQPLVLTGRVLGLDDQPIGGAELDVWQTASDGTYDVQSQSQTPMNMRGIFTTGSDGRYEIRSVRPVAYPIPGDGPAGKLLFANGRHNWRPGHVHFVVSASGYKPVITHLFDAESDHLDSDAVFGVRESLIVDMSDGTCVFDFVLEPDKAAER